MFDFQDKKNRYKMTAAALFTAAAMCVGGCGDAAAAQTPCIRDCPRSMQHSRRRHRLTHRWQDLQHRFLS